MTPDRRDQWVVAGHRSRHFFPHRIHHLPKCGPDGFRLASWMSGEREPSTMCQLVLSASDPPLSEFPPGLFFDDEVQWHRQQFGLPGHVASVNVTLRGSSLHTTAHLSDLVQRIGRRREHKTRVEKLFAGWDRMLLNGVLDFALERGVRWVHIPTSEHARAHTDQARSVEPGLFVRIYDSHPRSLYPLERVGDWWRIDVAQAAGRVLRLEVAGEALPAERRICVFHDVERGCGHLDSDPAFAARAERTAGASLTRMLAAERAAGVGATYNVVGLLLPDVREPIERDGHSLAFHSYDHELPVGGPLAPLRAARERLSAARRARAFARERPLARRLRDARSGLRSRLRVPPPGPVDTPQLDACRRLDYRLKGYRPPQSRIGPELSDANLLFHNFEWIASSPRTLGVRAPRLVNRLVRMPVLADDFGLYRGMPYEQWEAGVLAGVAAEDSFAAIGLHDCYGEYWLPRYERLLERLQEMGRLTTMDAVAAETTLAAAA